MIHMAHDADNGGPRRSRATAAHVLAKRILVRPVLARQVFVNHNHRLSALTILSGEVSTALEGNLHSLKVGGAHVADVAVRTRIARRGHSAFNAERRGAAFAAERERNGQGRRLHASHTRQTLQNRAIKYDLLFRLLVLDSRQGQACGHHTQRLKSGFDVLKALKTAEK